MFFKNKSSPIPWPACLRTAAQIACALQFPYLTIPNAIVYRDRKPANIFMDSSYKSRICDVGLSILVPTSVLGRFTQCLMTSAVGTIFYIDHECQKTRMSNTIKCLLFENHVITTNYSKSSNWYDTQS